MPKASKNNSKSPRRRGAAVVEEPAERGLIMRMVTHSPKDMVAGLIAFAAVSAIIANAMLLQAGRHPSPMFGSTVIVPLDPPAALTGPLPKPRPTDTTGRSSDLRPLDPRLLDARPVNVKAETKPADVRGGDPLANLVRASTAPSANAVARPPAAIPVSSRSDPLGDLIVNSRRIASVQRALTEYGYGQLKATGNIGPDTQAAIQRFERERKMPVTGQMSDRLVRDLSVLTGRAID